MESDVPLKSRFIPCLFLFCLIFSGCFQVHRRDVSHPAPLPDSFSESGTNPLPEKWWESFNDFQLNTLIEEALGQNFTIRAAWDRLSQAEEIAIKSGAALLPNADYLANARRTRQDVSDIVSYTSDYSLGLIASYEVDLWGRVRSSQQAAVLDAEAAKETVNAAAITLSAAIAKTWYQLAEAKQQEVVVTNQLNTNQKVLDIITLQFKQGQINAADVFRQRQLIESSRGQLILAKETIVLLQHQLSLLIGKNPRQYWAQDAIELFTPEQLPEISIPSDVLQRRPDVAVAYKTIQAADLRVASAVADQYPRISISATAETSAARASDLFDDWLGNLVGNAAGPLFDAGLRKAEVARIRAVLSQTINEYGQATLQAIKEVEDAINREHYQRQTISNFQAQLTLARQTSESTKVNYLNGQLDYLRVLEALVSQQSLERNELASRRILIEHRIDLCRAIAGSWEMTRPDQAQIQ
jgi:NodT family efflux transporter outer membrane factor (OMF) lipoprotein